MFIKSSFLTIFIIILLGTTTINAQSFDIYHKDILLKDYNYQNSQETSKSIYLMEDIKSVKITHNANELLDPIIQLNSSETLKISFDILGDEVHSYAYTFIHCDYQWNQSSIMQPDYLEGFFNNYINNYEYSFNTMTPYIYYTFTFPNEDIRFTKSGNYVLLIYNDDTKAPIITKRFMIYEDILNIDMNVKKATLAKDFNTKHEIDFSIYNYKQLNIIDPHHDLQIIIQKNDDWNDIITKCKPNFISNEVLDYDYQGQLSFLGGSEYHDFDIKSLRYYGKNIKSITENVLNKKTIHQVELYEDKIYDGLEYIFKYDLNGKYIISTTENKNKNTEADYSLVKFTLKSPSLLDGNIYIYGELTNWDFLPNAQMIYDEKNKEYHGSLLVKQGYYNYQYILKNDSKKKFINGNYHETRNQYSIYAYYSPQWLDYSRLVGVAKSTSNKLN